MIEKSLEAFVRGVSFTRSVTHPCEIITLGETAWLLRDAPRTNGDARNAEVTVYQREPAAVVELIQQNVTGKYFLCVMTDSEAERIAAEAAYKARGYRLMRREPLFVAPTAGVTASDDRVRRVTTQNDSDAVTKAAGRKQIPPERLSDDAALRWFAAFDGETALGWAQSLRTHPDCGWVSGLFVQEAQRGKGYGRALINALLADDAGRGLTHSVLLASQAGARLYPHLGYEELGTLLVLSPPKSPR